MPSPRKRVQLSSPVGETEGYSLRCTACLSLGLQCPLSFLSEVQARTSDTRHTARHREQAAGEQAGSQVQFQGTGDHTGHCAPFSRGRMHTCCRPQEAEPAFPTKHGTYWLVHSFGPSWRPVPQAAAINQGLLLRADCSMVSTTGSSAARSLPGFSR